MAPVDGVDREIHCDQEWLLAKRTENRRQDPFRSLSSSNIVQLNRSTDRIWYQGQCCFSGIFWREHHRRLVRSGSYKYLRISPGNFHRDRKSVGQHVGASCRGSRLCRPQRDRFRLDRRTGRGYRHAKSSKGSILKSFLCGISGGSGPMPRWVRMRLMVCGSAGEIRMKAQISCSTYFPVAQRSPRRPSRLPAQGRRRRCCFGPGRCPARRSPRQASYRWYH